VDRIIEVQDKASGGKLWKR